MVLWFDFRQLLEHKNSVMNLSGVSRPKVDVHSFMHLLRYYSRARIPTVLTGLFFDFSADFCPAMEPYDPLQATHFRKF